MDLNINIADIPEKALPIEPGTYDCSIESFDFKDAEGKQEDRYSVKLKVIDGPMKDRMIFENFRLSSLRDLTSFETIRFGHLCRSAGILGKPATTDFFGKTVKVVVIHKTATKDGQTETFANIKDYLYTK